MSNSNETYQNLSNEQIQQLETLANSTVTLSTDEFVALVNWANEGITPFLRKVRDASEESESLAIFILNELMTYDRLYKQAKDIVDKVVREVAGQHD